MSLRISSILPALALASCGGGNVTADQAAKGAVIECALAGSGDFQPQCGIEREEGTKNLVITHPDGGFRRLKLTQGGEGLIAADGAEPARVTRPEKGHIDVQIATDRYRLPTSLLDQP
jgi:hypothetical protein